MRRFPMKMGVAFLSCTVAFCAQAQVFKCPDATGKITYSDAPCSTPGGQRIDASTLRSNSLPPGHRPMRQRPPSATAEVAAQEPAAAVIPGGMPRCPSDQDVSNIKAAMTAIVVQKRMTSLRSELARAENCRLSGGQYSNSDWERMNLILRGFEDGAAEAREQDKQRQGTHLPREAPATLTNCDQAGCWDTSGRRYNNAAGGMFRQDGAFCRRVANSLQCN